MSALPAQRFAARAVAVAGAAAATLPLASPAAASGLEGPLRFLGEHQVSSSAAFGGAPFGGLSGIRRDARDGSYWAISDDRSEAAPARFYRLALDYSLAGFAGSTILSQNFMLRQDGSTFPARSVDAEAIEIDPDTGRLYWTSEGDRTGSNVHDPFVREMHADGTFVRELSLPSYFRATGPGGSGVRANLGLESLTFSPDRSLIFTATENALNQDGPAAGPDTGSLCRIVGFDVASGLAVSEHLYRSEPPHAPPSFPGGFVFAGLVEMLALSSTEFITVERSNTAGSGLSIRLFLTTIGAATNFIGSEQIPVGAIAAEKTLLLDLADLGIPLANYEGISLGHVLENGNRSLVLVSDNNLANGVATRFLAFEIVPAPGAMTLLGLAGLGARGRRRR